MFSGKVAYFYKPLQMYENSWRTRNKYTIYFNTLIKSLYLPPTSIQELIKVVSLAKDYPPRVRKIVADILGEMGQYDLQRKIANTVLPTTRFNLNYKTT